MELFEEIRRGLRGRRDDSRDWPRSTACIGGWCARRSPARSRRSEKTVEREAAAAGSGEGSTSTGCWSADRQAPRKQRHTAHRIWTRLREEHPEHPIGEATVRRYVQVRKRELGLSGREVFVPQSYELGQEAQVDWFEATAKLGGEAVQAAVLRDAQHGVGRRVSSGLHATPRSRLCWKATNMASPILAACSGPCATTIMTSAVKKILRGHQREETDRIIAFRSHWGFQSEYCNPASGNEKGGVEGELGWYRRNWLVPVPEASDLEALNEQVTGRLPGQPQPHDHRQEHDRRRSQRAGTGVSCCRWRRRDSRLTSPVSAGRGWQGPRESEDQLVFGAAVAGTARDGSGMAIADRDHA